MINKNLVIIGISCGGPKILRTVFTGLPILNAGIVIVQHMVKAGNSIFASSMNRLTDMDVKIADNGEYIENGKVYIAPSEVHLELENNNRLYLTNGPKVCYVRPSADVTMKSVKKLNRWNIFGIIMTGLGKDGVEGMRHIKSIGGTTIAQDEQSSVIWGMPKAAIDTGCIDYVDSPINIHKALISMLGVIGGK